MRSLEVAQGTYGSRYTFWVISRGKIVDLTNLDVFVRLKNRGSTAALWESQAIVYKASWGACYYVWQQSDLMIPGDYELELEIRSKDGHLAKTLNEKQSLRVLSKSTTMGYNAVNNYTSASGIASTGTDQLTAFALVAQLSEVTSVPSGTGVCLPHRQSGANIVVINSGTNNLLIYPANDGQNDSIGTASANVPLSATPGSVTEFFASSTKWYVK